VNKKLKSCLLALGLIAGSVGVAQATPAVWSDLHDPSDVLINKGEKIHFQHELDGYRPGVDTIYAASLTVWLYDDNLLGDSVFGDSHEKVKFDFDGAGWTTPTEVNGIGANLGWLDDFFEQTLSFNSLVALLSDGLLDVTVKGHSGDFRFDKSLLVAYGNRATVPEPATLALLGAGLLAMALIQRRRRRTVSI
jgi:hypothetical protein